MYDAGLDLSLIQNESKRRKRVKHDDNSLGTYTSQRNRRSKRRYKLVYQVNINSFIFCDIRESQITKLTDDNLFSLPTLKLHTYKCQVSGYVIKRRSSGDRSLFRYLQVAIERPVVSSPWSRLVSCQDCPECPVYHNPNDLKCLVIGDEREALQKKIQQM